MGKEQPDLNRAQANAYRALRKTEAQALGLDLKDFILAPRRRNDVTPGGPGPRHAIIELAQSMAAQGATYGQVLGQTVIKGDGTSYKINEGDLLGYVVANDYCILLPPKP